MQRYRLSLLALVGATAVVVVPHATAHAAGAALRRGPGDLGQLAAQVSSRIGAEAIIAPHHGFAGVTAATDVALAALRLPAGAPPTTPRPFATAAASAPGAVPTTTTTTTTTTATTTTTTTTTPATTTTTTTAAGVAGVPSPGPSAPSAGPGPVTPTPAVWAALRQCESGGNYAEDSGNGYYGAYQFSPSTWWWMGYSGMPDNAPPAVQDQAAERLMQRVGWSAWPVCSVTLGLR